MIEDETSRYISLRRYNVEVPDKEKNAIEKKMRLVGKTPYTEG